MAQSRHSKYYHENKTKCALASKAWREANREKVLEAKRRYRDKKAEREGRAVTHRSSRAVPRNMNLHQSVGMTEEGRAMIERLVTRPPVFFREGREIGVVQDGKIMDSPLREQIFDKDGVEIRYEGDEDLDLENEAVGAGRRDLKAQAAENSRNYYIDHKDTEIERSKLYRREHPEIERERAKHSVSKLKYNVGSRRRLLRERRVRVITHYGRDGRMACVICDERQGSLLRVDYINPGQDRLTKYSGDELYRRLEQDNYPEGYRSICLSCQIDIRRKEYRKRKLAEQSVRRGEKNG